MYRLQTNTGSWLRLGEDSSCLGFTKKPDEASLFATDKDAKNALARAIRRGEAKFKALFPEGEAPNHVMAYGRLVKGQELAGKALSVAQALDRIKRAKVERFEPPAPVEQRVMAGALWGIVSEDGLFARIGATGWLVFTEHLHEATFFESETAASKLCRGGAVAKEAKPKMASARIVGFALAPSASLHPLTLNESLNDATGAMMSALESKALNEAMAPTGKEKKPTGSAL